MTKLEQLEQQLLDIQAELAELKATTQHGETSVYETPWQVVDVDNSGYYFSVRLDGSHAYGVRPYTEDLNAFVKEEVAQGFANAFHVMVALRQCEGAGQFDCDRGWVINEEQEVDVFPYYHDSKFTLCPPFPSGVLAQAAAESVGIDKIKAAYEFLAKGVV